MATERPLPLGAGSYAGVSFGPGLAVQVVDHDGLEETPALRTNDQNRTMGHGTWTNADWYGGRTLTMTFAILGSSPDDLRVQLAAVEAAWLPDSIDRPLWLYDGNRFLTARVRRRRFDHSVGGRGPVSRVTVQFYARNPFYQSAQQSVDAALSVVSGGMSWPLAWPLSFGSVSGGGATIVNQGTVAAPVLITVAGPATNPAITNETLSATVRVNIVLASGDVLTLDSDARTVILNGGPSRIAYLDPTSHWWGLQPGSNIIRYTSGSAVSTEKASILYSSTWP